MCCLSNNDFMAFSLISLSTSVLMTGRYVLHPLVEPRAATDKIGLRYSNKVLVIRNMITQDFKHLKIMYLFPGNSRFKNFKNRICLRVI